MSVTVKASGKVKTPSRIMIHSYSMLTDCFCSLDISYIADFQIKASDFADNKSGLLKWPTVNDKLCFRPVSVFSVKCQMHACGLRVNGISKP